MSKLLCLRGLLGSGKTEVDYEIQVSRSTTSLNANVSGRMKEGWELWGSPFMFSESYMAPVFVQALVKYDETPLEQQIQQLQTELEACNKYIHYITHEKGCEGFPLKEDGNIKH